MTQHAFPAPWRRRLILVSAVASGALASAGLHTGFSGSGPVYAQAPAVPAVPPVPPVPDVPDVPPVPAKASKLKIAKLQPEGTPVTAPAHPVAAQSTPATANPPATDSKGAAAPAAGDAKPAAAADSASDADDDAEDATPAPRKRHHGATVGITVDDDDKVRVSGMGAANGHYDSFESFARSAPWMAGVAFLGLTLFFMVPLAIIVLLIWYKMRKNRMLNETMLKLAEKGVMPPAEAMAALGATPAPAASAASPVAASLYEQARAIRGQRTWSDLRRGVILGAVGLGFQAYSLFESGEANWLGLTLMFLGGGYILLWFFEERQHAIDPPRGGTGA
jgi:hypothetical protein